MIVSAAPPRDQRDWETFVNQTYGSLADDPIERGDQGISEVRERLFD